MIYGRNVFDRPMRKNKKTCENIRKTPSGQGDDYKFGSVLVHTYFKENYKLIAIDLSKKACA